MLECMGGVRGTQKEKETHERSVLTHTLMPLGILCMFFFALYVCSRSGCEELVCVCTGEVFHCLAAPPAVEQTAGPVSAAGDRERSEGSEEESTHTVEVLYHHLTPLIHHTMTYSVHVLV